MPSTMGHAWYRAHANYNCQIEANRRRIEKMGK
jgi:hypothetical protein